MNRQTKRLTVRERAEQEAKRLMVYDRYTEEGFADRIEEIINAALKEDRESTKLVDGVFGSIFGIGFQVIAHKVGDVKKAIAIEREACAKIADSFKENPNGLSGDTRVTAIAANIRARGEKKEEENRLTT